MLEAFCTRWMFCDFHIDFFFAIQFAEKKYFAEQCCFEIHLFVLFIWVWGFFFSYLRLVNGPFCWCFCIYIVFVKLLAMGTTKKKYCCYPATLILFYSMCTNKLYRC